MNDPVNHPRHYTNGEVECIEAIRAALGTDAFVAYCRGNAIKYAWRAGLKVDCIQDLRKGAWYLTKAANTLYSRTAHAAAMDAAAEAARLITEEEE